MKFIITEDQFNKITKTFKGIPYKSIIKYIKSNYHPDDVVVKFPDSDKEGLLIIFKFNNIDVSYITNRHAFSLEEHKMKNLEIDIRKDILTFFGIKTTGLTIVDGPLKVSAPFKYEDLTVLVRNSPLFVD
jgi:uncharacterized protein YprB with RNaseH-like and TPR domain